MKIPRLVPAPLLLLLCSALLLSGCVSFDGIAPGARAIDQLTLATPAGIVQADSNWPRDAWWSKYADAQLEKLITHALQNNPTLVSAQTRITRAQAAAGMAQANGAPQVGAALDMSYGRYSENYQIPRPPIGKAGQNVGQGLAALSFSYDLDLWDKNGAVIRAAEAQVKAAEFDRAAARLALTTSIVRSYAQLAAQYDLQDILNDTLKQRIAIGDLSRQRVASGLDSRVELMLNTSNVAALRAELVQLETSQAVTRLQLAALAGDMPGASADLSRPVLGKTPFNIPASLPLDLLGRRPELAAQRARIRAAIGDADAARAQFYPNINLSGLIGLQSFGLGQLLAAGSMTDSIGPAIRLPIFDGGRLRANYAIKTAEIDGAITQYNQSVVTAAQDVSEQLTRIAALEREEQASNAALAAAQEAWRLAMLRYQGGLSPYLTVLTVESQLLGQRRAAAELKARRQDLQIGLVRALGGGFSDSPAQLAGNP